MLTNLRLDGRRIAEWEAQRRAQETSEGYVGVWETATPRKIVPIVVLRISCDKTASPHTWHLEVEVIWPEDPHYLPEQRQLGKRLEKPRGTSARVARRCQFEVARKQYSSALVRVAA
jgi:hypothetical protein